MLISIDSKEIERHIEILERELREMDRIVDSLERQYRQSLNDFTLNQDFLQKQLEFAKKEKNRIILRKSTLLETMNIAVQAKQSMEDKVYEATRLQKDRNRI